jgi:hypothetical protein
MRIRLASRIPDGGEAACEVHGQDAYDMRNVTLHTWVSTGIR